MKYFPFANLGCSISINRELGVNLGANNSTEIVNIIKSAKYAQTLFPIPVVFIIILISFFLKPPLSWLLIIASLVGYLQNHQNLLVRILSTEEKHGHVAQINISKSILSLIIILPLTYFISLKGRSVGSILLNVVLYIITILFIGYTSFSLKYNTKTLKRLINIGLFFSIQGFLITSLFLTDRIVAGSILGLKSLGIYAFAIYVVNIVEGIKKSVQSVLFQRQHFIYGRDKNLSKDLLRITKTTVLLVSDLTSIVAGIILIPFSLLVYLYFPEYKTSIEIAYIIVYSQVLGTFNIMNTINQHKKYTLYISIAVSLNILLSIFMAKYLGLLGIAIATLITFSIYNIVLSIINLKYFSLRSSEITKIIFRLISVPLASFTFVQIFHSVFRNVLSSSDVNIIFLGLVVLVVFSISSYPILRIILKNIKLLNSFELQN